MITSEEFFGPSAGKIWEALKNNGPLTASKLCEVTELQEREVRSALGWLGREGKLNIEKVHKVI